MLVEKLLGTEVAQRVNLPEKYVKLDVWREAEPRWGLVNLA
jgi:hypothetical protein